MKAKALTEEELRRLLDELPDRWRLLFELMAHTGLRVGEVLALQWLHLDLGRRRVQVRRRWYRGTFAPPKSRFGRRDVPITEGMSRALWELRKQSRARDDELRAPVDLGDSPGRCEPGSSGARPGRETGGCAVGHLPYVAPHVRDDAVARHGLNAKQVQGWLGHHAASFTIDTYIHLLDDDLPDAGFLDGLAAQGNAEGNTKATRPTETTRNAGTLKRAESA